MTKHSLIRRYYRKQACRICVSRLLLSFLHFVFPLRSIIGNCRIHIRKFIISQFNESPVKLQFNAVGRMILAAVIPDLISRYRNSRARCLRAAECREVAFLTRIDTVSYHISVHTVRVKLTARCKKYTLHLLCIYRRTAARCECLSIICTCSAVVEIPDNVGSVEERRRLT